VKTSSLDNWFSTEVLPHEAALMRYLARVWPHRAELPDLRQEIYVRVFESAARERPSAPKAFLFATAKNLLVDRLRHNRVISIDFTLDFDRLDVLVDEISPEREINALQELRRLAAAFDSLSDRCREVIWLRVHFKTRHEALESRSMHNRA
jgi:RNA polymerase sigma factor (sigma-70 family)